jgi:Uma2 family endonuclease
MNHATIALISEAEYLSGETHSQIRHEYISGNIYAMAGASKAHGVIALNIATRLRQHLRGTPCRSFIADMKVRVQATNAYYYPDVVVTCSERDTAANTPKDYLTAPSLIIDVLSPATETIDRREKMQAYAQLEGLQEYVLVESRLQQVEVYRRHPEGWEQWVWTADEIFKLDSVSLEMSLAEVYEDVVF